MKPSLKVLESKAVKVKSHIKKSGKGKAFPVLSYTKSVKGKNKAETLTVPKKVENFVKYANDVKSTAKKQLSVGGKNPSDEAVDSLGASEFFKGVTALKKSDPSKINQNQKDIISYVDGLIKGGETYGTVYKKLTSGQYEIEGSGSDKGAKQKKIGAKPKTKQQKEESKFFELFPDLKNKQKSDTIEPTTKTEKQEVKNDELTSDAKKDDTSPDIKKDDTSPDIKKDDTSPDIKKDSTKEPNVDESSIGEKFTEIDDATYAELQKNPVYEGMSKEAILELDANFKKRMKDVMDEKISSDGDMTYNQLVDEFEKRGKSLLLVGGCVRDMVEGKSTSKDLDFVTNAKNHKEILSTLQEINPKWEGYGKQEDIGLVTIKDKGKPVVDITPFHTLTSGKFGKNIKDDAESRDLTINSLFLDTKNGKMVNPTTNGIKDINNKTLDFTTSDSKLDELFQKQPRDFFRAIKFMARGYKISDRSRKIINDYSPKYLGNLAHHEAYRFIRNQIYYKSGYKGVTEFGDVMKKEFPSMYNGDNNVKNEYNEVLNKVKEHPDSIVEI